MVGKWLGPLGNSARCREPRHPRHQLLVPPYHPVERRDKKKERKNNRHINNLFHAFHENNNLVMLLMTAANHDSRAKISSPLSLRYLLDR